MNRRLSRPMRWMLTAGLTALLLASAASAEPKDKAALDLAKQAIEVDYLGTNFAQAEAKLKKALAMCKGNACSAKVIGQIHRDLGVVAIAGLKKLDEGKQHFADALKADPAVQLDPGPDDAGNPGCLRRGQGRWSGCRADARGRRTRGRRRGSRGDSPRRRRRSHSRAAGRTSGAHAGTDLRRAAGRNEGEQGDGALQTVRLERLEERRHVQGQKRVGRGDPLSRRRQHDRQSRVLHSGNERPGRARGVQRYSQRAAPGSDQKRARW